MPVQIIAVLFGFFAVLGSYINVTAHSPNLASRTRHDHGHSHGGTVPCDGFPAVPTERKACRLYVWDVSSAICYRWCHHLLKGNLFEGRGGKMFVRYEPNSMLQLLYPCSRYSPDRCVFCGGAYKDHLTLWWSKHLYSPFDRILDKTYNSAVQYNDDSDSVETDRQRRKSDVELHGPPTFGFHRQYVADVTDLLRQPTSRFNRREIRKRVREKIGNIGKQESVLVSSPDKNVKYIVREAVGHAGKRPSFTLIMSRLLAVRSLNSLIKIQEAENARLQSRL